MKITFLPHARRRMEERGITEEEVAETLVAAQSRYPGDHGRTVAEHVREGRRLALKVVYNEGLEDEVVVVTVELGRPTRREGGRRMSYRFEHDPQSGAFYIRVREGEYAETVALAESGFGAGVDIDAEGNVLGFEFLSFEEYAELLARHGGELNIPERIEDPAHFRLSPA